MPVDDERSTWVARGTGVSMVPDDQGEALDLEALPSRRANRYRDAGLIGIGSMGEVRRVYDLLLHRQSARKLLRTDFMRSRAMRDRFVNEARVTARLEHPGIVPVHDVGTSADGRPYFTMREIHGRNFLSMIRDVHQRSHDGVWQASDDGWTLRRLVATFLSICETVGYAHARGVIHRDLKPENVMVGDHGEVLVVDWGLAKELDATEPLLPDSPRVARARDTLHGTVFGTPNYMPPEQAAGQLDKVGLTADVYALGAILYEVLSGKPPYGEISGAEALERVKAGPPESIRDSPLPGPEELFEACERAMARRPEDRYDDASRLARAVARWLEGTRARAEAQALVVRARALEPRIRSLWIQARRMEREARSLLDPIALWAPTDAKRPAWALQDRAVALHNQAELAELDRMNLLQSALTRDPDHSEARRDLALFFRRAHAEAELARKPAEAARMEVLLSAHDDGTHAAYIEGRGTLSLRTEPPGATVVARRYTERDRTLILGSGQRLGTTPIEAVSLPHGSYVLDIRADGCAPVRYPAQVLRLGHWHGMPPHSDTPAPVCLPRADELADHEIYVPAGWTTVGDDHVATDSTTRDPTWVAGFSIGRHAVSKAEYLDFLNDLVDQGRSDEAQRHQPLEPARSGGPAVNAIFPRADGGHFTPVDGPWQPTWPVVWVDWHGAAAYAHWLAQRTQQPWRLPTELEWEKAARGVDHRTYPWGDFFDPSFACVRGSRAGRDLPCPREAFPFDQSPYGVRHVAGNTSDWCADTLRDDLRPESSHVIRGGCWLSSGESARLHCRAANRPELRGETIGFRVARSWPEGLA